MERRLSVTFFNVLRRSRNHRLFSVAKPLSVDAAQNPQTKPEKSKDTKPTPLSSRVTVTFVTADGKRHTVQAKTGDTLLDVVVNHQIPLDGYGACEGTLACSTCHVVLKPADYAKLPNKPSDEEMDMLDLAYGLTDTSRLGCQIVLTKELDGLEVIVPEGTHDARQNE